MHVNSGNCYNVFGKQLQTERNLRIKVSGLLLSVLTSQFIFFSVAQLIKVVQGNILKFMKTLLFVT